MTVTKEDLEAMELRLRQFILDVVSTDDELRFSPEQRAIAAMGSPRAQAEARLRDDLRRALIAAAEQRAEGAKEAAHIQGEALRDLRAKLAAAEREAGNAKKLWSGATVQLLAAQDQVGRLVDDNAQEARRWAADLAKCAEERDAARGRAVEVLREFERHLVGKGWLAEVNLCTMLADMIAAEEARGK